MQCHNYYVSQTTKYKWNFAFFPALRQSLREPRRRPSRERGSEEEREREQKMQKKKWKWRELRQEVSDVADIDQIMKVFLARSIPIDGRVCARLHISRLRCNFSTLPSVKVFGEKFALARRPFLATNAEYWVSRKSKWMRNEDFSHVSPWERHTFIIERVANGNSTEQNLISFRFVAFAFEWNVRLRHTQTQRKISSIRSITFDRQSFAFSFNDVGVVVDGVMLVPFATTTVFDGRRTHTMRISIHCFVNLTFRWPFSIHVDAVGAHKKIGLNWRTTLCVCVWERRHHSDLMEPSEWPSTT